MIGVPLALAIFGYGEWAIHRFRLPGSHGLDHHQAARKNGGYDPAYEGPAWSTSTQAREVLGLFGIGLAHVPLFPIAPFYTSTIWYCLLRYRAQHRRAHLDPAWMRDHLSWHCDHHLGDDDQNFGVVWAWVDVLAGTRRIFVGTDLERAQHAARATVAAAGRAVRAQRRDPLRRLIARMKAVRPA